MLVACGSETPGDEQPTCSPISEPQTWASWPMPNPTATRLPHPTRYEVDEARGIVNDSVTGLSWQRDFSPTPLMWDDAKSYCSCASFGGEHGWRLPSRIELVSLEDFTRASPTIDSAAFPATPDENFWTSSPVIINPGLVYLVYFQNGHTTYSQFDYEYRARCVRGGESAPAERYTISDGIVFDTQTELTWQQVFPPARQSWADATAYCGALELAGGGWRLPSINELQTLVDDSKNPAIELAAFPSTPSEYFWSSSTVVGDASRAWTAFFTNGSTYSFAMTALKNVRCVR
jgi:hypothetical protein